MAPWHFQKLSKPATMDFSAAIEALYRLNTGVIGTEAGRHERPHKPVLLLAVFDALASGKAQPNRVEWSAWLRERFRIYFEQVRSHDDSCTPEFPFFHLKGDGFWLPLSVGTSGESPLAAPPKVRDANTGRVFGLPFPRAEFLSISVSLENAVFSSGHSAPRTVFSRCEPTGMTWIQWTPVLWTIRFRRPARRSHCKPFGRGTSKAPGAMRVITSARPLGSNSSRRLRQGFQCRTDAAYS